MYQWIGNMTSDERILLRINRLMKLLPVPVRIAALWVIGLIVYALAGRLRRTIRRNIRRMLEGAGSGRLRMYRSSVAFFGQLMLTIYEISIDAQELPHTAEHSTASERFIRKRFEVNGEHHLEQALSQGRGVIVFASHLGNFFYYFWLLSRKVNGLAVATASSDELRPIYLRFNRKGCAGLDYDQTPPLKLFRDLQSHLEQGGAVFLLGDFWRPTFPVSSLLGMPNRSPEGAAMLALKTGAPVVPLFGRRMKGFRHLVTFGAPIQLSGQFNKCERAEATLCLNAVLEQMIMHSPSQWFYWFNVHERWEDN